MRTAAGRFALCAARSRPLAATRSRRPTVAVDGRSGACLHRRGFFLGDPPKRRAGANATVQDVSPHTMFEVIRDVQQYQEFLPYCSSSTVVSDPAAKSSSSAAAPRSPSALATSSAASSGSFVGKLSVSYGGLYEETYSSRVAFEEPSSVRSTALDSGKFKHLVSDWKIAPLRPTAAPTVRIHTLRSPLLLERRVHCECEPPLCVVDVRASSQIAFGGDLRNWGLFGPTPCAGSTGYNWHGRRASIVALVTHVITVDGRTLTCACMQEPGCTVSCELEFRATGLLLDQLLAGNAESIVGSQVKAFVARARIQQQHKQQQQRLRDAAAPATTNTAAAVAAGGDIVPAASAQANDTAHWERQQREAATRGWQPS
jgi:ribosome-associated toxin RatA of RatAB toxin-antitoxin module